MRPGSYDGRTWNSRQGSGAPIENPWTTTSPLIEGIHFLNMDETGSSMPKFMPTRTMQYTPVGGAPSSPHTPTNQTGTDCPNYPSHNYRATGPTWMEYHPSHRPPVHRGPPMTGAPDSYYMMPGGGPLPDSPPEAVKRNWRRRGEYHGKGTSRPFAGRDHVEEIEEDEGGEGPTETAEQQIARIEAQMALMHNENFRLQHNLETEKKKQPSDCRRPPRPGPHHDHYSIPRPPDFGGGPGPGPVGV